MPDGGTLTLSTQRVGRRGRDRRRRHGDGDDRGGALARLRPVLHDEGQGRDGARALGLVRHHPPPRGRVEVESEVGRARPSASRSPRRRVATAQRHRPRRPPRARPAARRTDCASSSWTTRTTCASCSPTYSSARAARSRSRARGARRWPLRRAEFDAVFTDVGTAGMSGWELARAVRERDGRVALAVITGWGEAVTPEEQSRRAGRLGRAQALPMPSRRAAACLLPPVCASTRAMCGPQARRARRAAPPRPRAPRPCAPLRRGHAGGACCESSCAAAASRTRSGRSSGRTSRVAERDGADDRVLKLAYVAGPVVCDERAHGVAREADGLARGRGPRARRSGARAA
jgi:CheY-like chemotaxis protein